MFKKIKQNKMKSYYDIIGCVDAEQDLVDFCLKENERYAYLSEAVM